MTDWFDLGGISARVISGGRFRLDGGAMFGIIPRVLWQRTDPPDDQHRVQLDSNCVLVRTRDSLVLIETGWGNKLPTKQQGQIALETGVTIRTRLEIAGVGVDEIDCVLLSHLHMDHVGGASEIDADGNIAPVFPRARYVVQRGEWNDALANRSIMRVSYLPDNLHPLEASGRLRLLDGEDEVVNGVSVCLAPGHTRYHQTVHVQGANRRLVFAGDVLPTWSHIPGPYNMAYDMVLYDNMLQKLQLLHSASKNGWFVVTSHDAKVPIGLVEREGDARYRVTPP